MPPSPEHSTDLAPAQAADLFKIGVKIFAQRDDFAPGEFVPVFHRWIQNGILADHLLIDVADYAHVPEGPGTVLVTSQANLYTDRRDHRLGLLYVRKLDPLPGGDFRQRLELVITAALKAAALLESEPALAGRLKFKTDELSIRFHDRLLAPNTPDTFAQLRPDIAAAAERFFGSGAALECANSPARLLEVSIKAKSASSLRELLIRGAAALA